MLPNTIGFVGLGAMGAPMVKRLRHHLPSPIAIYVYDISPAAFDSLDEVDGLQRCSSAATICENADFIISIVPEGKDVRALFEEGFFLTDNMAAGKIFVDCSTIDIETSTEVSAAVRQRGCSYYDAPVSGGTMGAEKGTLTFMMGIKEDDPDYAMVHTVCSTMGANLFACGGPTLGLAAS